MVDARGEPHPAAFAARALPEEIARIIALARKRYTVAGLAMGDALSRRWLSANASPLAAEIAAVAAVGGQPGT